MRGMNRTERAGNEYCWRKIISFGREITVTEWGEGTSSLLNTDEEIRKEKDQQSIFTFGGALFNFTVNEAVYLEQNR